MDSEIARALSRPPPPQVEQREITTPLPDPINIYWRELSQPNSWSGWWETIHRLPINKWGIWCPQASKKGSKGKFNSISTNANIFISDEGVSCYYLRSHTAPWVPARWKWLSWTWKMHTLKMDIKVSFPHNVIIFIWQKVGCYEKMPHNAGRITYQPPDPLNLSNIQKEAFKVLLQHIMREKDNVILIVTAHNEGERQSCIDGINTTILLKVWFYVTWFCILWHCYLI